MNHQDTKAPRNAGIPAELDAIAAEVVDAAYKIHRALGPGLLEAAYEACFEIEMRGRGLGYEKQVSLPIRYNEHVIANAFRLDVLVENELVVEIKAVEKLLAVHEAQLLTYLKLTGKRLGLLINFNVPLIRDGIRRFAL